MFVPNLKNFHPESVPEMLREQEWDGRKQPVNIMPLTPTWEHKNMGDGFAFSLPSLWPPLTPGAPLTARALFMPLQLIYQEQIEFLSPNRYKNWEDLI